MKTKINTQKLSIAEDCPNTSTFNSNNSVSQKLQRRFPLKIKNSLGARQSGVCITKFTEARVVHLRWIGWYFFLPILRRALREPVDSVEVLNGA